MNEFFKSKNVELPRNVIAGHDVLGEIKTVCSNIKSERIGSIIAGETTFKAAGQEVMDHLVGYDIDVCLLGEASQENVNKACEQLKEHGAEFIIGVGGGSKIDITKVVAYKLGIPYISVPTSAAHDGIASNRASIKSITGSVSVQTNAPLGIIADTNVIVKAPYRLLASGCADVVSNLTAVRDWKFAKKMKNEVYSSSASLLSMTSAQSIVEQADFIKPDLEESVWVAIKPILLSGLSMCVANSSRPTSGAEHMISHTIDQKYPGRALHGEQVGVASIFTMCLHKGNWMEIRDTLANIGAPTTAAEIGLSEDEFIDAVLNAHRIRSDRFTILGEKGISKRSAIKAAKETGVI